MSRIGFFWRGKYKPRGWGREVGGLEGREEHGWGVGRGEGVM